MIIAAILIVLAFRNNDVSWFLFAFFFVGGGLVCIWLGNSSTALTNLQMRDDFESGANSDRTALMQNVLTNRSV